MAEDIMLTAGVDTTPGERRLAELASRASRTRLNLTANVDDSSVVAFGKPLGRITGQADEFTKSMEAANARVLAFGASVGVINGITSAFKNLISSTIEVENSLTQIKIVGDETFSSIKEVSSGIFNVARQTGLSFKEASEATLEFSRQGKSLTESLEAAKAALILTRTTGLDATEAVKGLTSAVNVFSESGLTMERIVNKLAAVDTKFAVSSRDLIEGISRSASVAQEAGVSFDELTAFITTLQEKTGRGGAVIGNAMKTIFTRVQNPEILNDIKALGIAVEDTAGNFLPATQIVKNLAKEFDFLDKNVQKSILLKVGGGFQVDKTAALINDVAKANGTFQRSLSESANAQNQAYAKTAQLNQTLSASFQNLLTSSKELGSNVGSITFSKDFTNIINSLGAGLQSLNDTIFGKDDGFKKSGDTLGQTVGRSILSGIGSVISGPALGIFLAIIAKLGYDFVKFSVQGLQTLLKITSQTKEEESIQKSIGELLYNNLDLQQKIFRLGDNRVAQAKELLKVYKEQGEQTKLMEQTKKEVASALYDSGLRGVASGQPRIVAKASSGFLPSLSQAIISEKKQAPSSSKIIIDHNFPFGGGTRGTMVYNSNETRVPNFGGTGGDAIIPNYAISAAKGYVPNFAKKEKDTNSSQQSQKPDLLIDASAASVAGVTAGGERGMIDKAKGKTITPDLLKKYEGSPFTSYLSNFGKINLVNVPVGNVYRTREGIKENEDSIKKNFTTRINTSLRPSILDFIQTELNRLQLNPGAGLRGNLDNLKFDIINSSSAGYILEEILKAPTLTDAERLGQYKSQSESSFFDMYNLNPEFAESFGLPKRTYDYVDVKLGFKELKDTITSKYLNQAILEGGGASKLIKSAASGYIPNFADEIFPISKEMSELGNIQSKDNADPFDNFQGNVKLIRQDKSIEDYGKQADKVVKNIFPKSKLNENFLQRQKNEFKQKGASDTSLQTFESILRNPSSGYAQRNSITKGILGELDAKKMLGKNILGSNSFFDFAGYVDARTRKSDSAQEILKKGVNYWLRNKSYTNKQVDKIKLPDMTAIVASNTQFSNAAKGYIPNFSELTGSGAGMLYQDINFNELGGGQSGKFLAPKSGEGFGQKIFYKLGSDKINQELQVNKSIKDFEKEDPLLFAKNAISFTNVGKLLTKNGLAAGFEREVIGGLGVDEFATGTFSKGGNISPKSNFAFYLSELLAQSGVKNVVGEYRKKYGQNSLGIDDVYAQNFKVNDIMQKLLIDETNQFFKGKKNTKDSDVDNYIKSLNGNPLVNSLNEKFGSAGGRHTMFDTQGFAKNASKGYIPNFAKMDMDLLTVNPAIAKLSVDEFIEKYLGSEYSTGLSGTSGNALKISGSPQQMAEAKRDFIMSMLGPNFLATYDRSEKSNRSRTALISQKSTSTGTRVKKEGGYMRASGNYAQTDLSAALEGTFSGNVKKINYEDLDKKAEMVFEKNNLTQYWNEIVKTMQLVGNAYTSEMVSANNAGVRPDFDYNTVEVPEEGKFKYGLQETYRAKDKIKKLTGLIRPKLIQGLLEGEKDIQGLVLNQPEYDKGSGVQGDYFVLLDEKAAQLKKLVSDYLINPNLDPLQAGTSELSENKFKVKELLNILDGQFGSEGRRGGLLLDELKRFREYSKGNPQLQKFFMDGEDRPGAFLVKKMMDSRTGESSNRLGAFLKPELPQSIIERMATVLAAVHNRGGIFPLSNLDVGYTGQLSYAGSKNNPLIDTFATSPNAPAQTSPISIPSTLKYGKYLEKKDYYNSVAKWKYDQASTSMVRQASKGYIPNFAGGGIIQALKEKAKKIIKNPIAQTLFDQAVETLLGLPEGFESSEIINQINFALANPNPQMELAKIKRKKRSENRQEKIRDYIARNASSASGGYIPNFASGIQDAINREKSATGLPDSMIKVSRDSRATNPSLNPSGIIVTNKIDEPRGAFDVPDYRMKTAYKNAVKSFYPNFAKDNVSGGAQPVGSNAMKTLGAAIGVPQTVVENLTKAIVDNTKETKTSTEVDKVKARTNQDPYNSPSANFYASGRVPVQTNFSSSGPSATLDQAIERQRQARLNNQNAAQSMASGRFTYSNGPASEPPLEPPLAIPRGLPRRVAAETQSTPKEMEKADFGAFAQKFVVLQSSISFLTGALSSLGDEGQKAAQVLGSLGQLGYLVSQGNDVFKLLNKGRGVGDVISASREGFRSGGFRGLIGDKAKDAVAAGVSGAGGAVVAGRVGAGVAAGAAGAAGTAGTAGTAAVAASGLGGAAAATLALGTTAALGAAGLYGLYKAIDAIGDVSSKAAVQGRKMGEVFDLLASRYSVKLTDAQQSRLSDIIEAGNIKGTSLAGSSNRSGFGLPQLFRSTKERLGIDNETWRTSLEESVAKLEMTGENSQQFIKLFAPVLNAGVEEKVGVKTESGTLFDRKKFINETVNQFSQLVDGLKTQVDSAVEESYKIYDVNRYKADLQLKKMAGSLSKEERTDLFDITEGAAPAIEEKLKAGYRSDANLQFMGDELKKRTPNALEAAAAVAEPEQAKLKSIELFKREIELKIQSIKLESLLTTEEERRLSVQKDLLTTSASERFSQEMLLKKIQEEKQLQLQLKELYAVKAKEKAEEYLGKIGVGIEAGAQKDILSGLDKITNAQSNDIQTLKEGYNDILKAADFAQRANDKAILEYTNKLANPDIKPDERKDIENKLEEKKKGSSTTLGFKKSLELEEKAIYIQARANEESAKSLQFQKAKVDQINYAISFRKDILTAQIALEQKSFDIKQKTLDIQNKINDSEFKTSNINFANPNEEASISQSREERRNIGTSFEREMQQIKADIEKENLSNKQSVFNTALQRGATPDQLSSIKTATNVEDAYKVLGDVLKNNANGFENSVKNAASYFYEATVKSAQLVAKEGIARLGKPSDKMPPKFLQDLNEKYATPFNISGYKAEDLLPPETSAKDTKDEREKQAIADRTLKITQYSYAQEKKFLDFRVQALSYSLQTAQKQLEIEKQRIDTAQKLKDLQFEGQAMQEFNPVKAQKLRNAYQIDQGISQAQSSDLLANKSYLNDAKSKAFSEAQSRGGTLEDLKSIIEATNVKDIEDRLTKIIEDQITKTGSTDVGDIQVNAAKEAAKITVDAAKQAASISTGQPFNVSETYTPSVDAKKLIDNPKEAANLIAKGKLGNAPVTQLDQAKQIADAQRANEAIRQNNESSFSTGMNQSLGEMQGRVDTFQNSIGREIPNAFRDGMVSAMKAASDVNNTKPLKDRLLDVANAFIDRINTKLMESIADNLTGGLANTGSGLMSAASSGIKGVFGFASGGQVSGGSGSKDDVPAMLTGGEFVVTKNAVNKYGPEFLTALNSGKIKKFATGGFVERDLSKYTDAKNLVNINSPIRGNLAFGANGQVENLLGVDRESLEKNNPGLYEYNMKKAQTEYYGKNAQSGEGGYFMPGQNGQGAIMGQRNLLAFATQNTTSTKFDKTVSGSDFAGIDIGAGSANLSLSALRDSNNLKNKQYLDSKQQATDLYFSGVDATKQKTDLEEQNRKAKQEYDEQQKKARKQFWISAAVAAGSSLASRGISSMAAGAANRMQSYSTAGGQEMSSWDKLGYGLKGTMVGAEGSGGLAGYFRGAGNSTQRLDTFQQGMNGQMYAWNNSSNQYVAAKYNPYSSFVNPNTNPFAYRKAAGGQVAGAGNGDNVPTMLNGGEFVMSKQATQRMGPQKLQQINSGGESGDSEGVATRIEAKLEELIEKIAGVGTINITVNGDSKNSKEDTTSSSGSSENNKELARKIKEMVLYTIKEEKRLGGMLR